MEGINISLDEVRQAAETVSALNQSLDQRLREIQKDMKSLQDSWSSTAATTIQAKFDTYAQKYFDTYRDVIDSYVAFLRKTVADNYDQTETTINNNANQFI